MMHKTVVPSTAIRDTRADKVFNFLNKAFVWILIFIVLYPIIYIISASISDPDVVNSGEMWLYPIDITFDGYKRVFNSPDIWIGYRNTIFYTVAGTLINLLVTLPCAYALSRRDLIGKSIVMKMLIFTMFFDGGMIPTYLLIRDLGMLNTVWAMIIPGAASVWNIIVTMTFFRSSIPRALEEQAEIDGASVFKTFTSIVLPLSLPIIAVMALFYGVAHWNSYFSALIYLTDRDLFPLQLILREILIEQELTAQLMVQGGNIEAIGEQAKIASSIKYAVMIVSSLPLLIAYPFVQKYFIKGVLIGSVKE